ncbi:hypothetical protein [Acidicapsa acidisoli]|nr:hypothetical protein [Acidicapsa acidisoli]
MTLASPQLPHAEPLAPRRAGTVAADQLRPIVETICRQVAT